MFNLFDFAAVTMPLTRHKVSLILLIMVLMLEKSN